jgi:hypothetical protein
VCLPWMSQRGYQASKLGYGSRDGYQVAWCKSKAATEVVWEGTRQEFDNSNFSVGLRMNLPQKSSYRISDLQTLLQLF